MQNAAQKYLQTQVTTTTSGDVLIMLYDGAIKFLKRAVVKMKEKDVAEKGILIAKALDIINELQCSLNKEKGGQLAENLNNLYFYCNAQLLMANLKLDTALVEKVIGILGELRSAFVEIQSMTPTGETRASRGIIPSGSGQPMAGGDRPVPPQFSGQPMTSIQPPVAPPSGGRSGQTAAPNAAAAQYPASAPAATLPGVSHAAVSPAAPGLPDQAAQPAQPAKPASVRNIRSQRGMAAYMNS